MSISQINWALFSQQKQNQTFGQYSLNMQRKTRYFYLNLTKKPTAMNGRHTQRNCPWKVQYS